MTSSTAGVRLLILDRDGVINEDSADYVKSPEEWIPLPGSLEAIASLNDSGYTVAVASNQSGLARGYFDEAALDAMHAKFEALLNDVGGRIDRIEICPHGPDDACECRKPRPGMIKRLIEHYAVDPGEVIVVGDSRRDLEAALAAGARPVLVRTGNGMKTEAALDGSLKTTPVFDSLAALAAYVGTLSRC